MMRKIALPLTLGLLVLSCNTEVSETSVLKVTEVIQHAYEKGVGKDYYHTNNLATYRIEVLNPEGLGGDAAFRIVDTLGKFKTGDEVELIIRRKVETPKVPIQVEKTR